MGALFVLNNSKEWIEAVASWGALPEEAPEHVFSRDACWSLRRGRTYVIDDSRSGLVCRHWEPAVTNFGSICVPMMAQGTALGVFSMRIDLDPDGGRRLSEGKQQLAVSVAEHIALALSSLRLRETLHEQAIRDSLTGLSNRRYMLDALEREVRRAERHKTTIGVILLDLDRFRRYNDEFGHDVGDVILREFGHFMQAHVRGEDTAARYGGEEFLLSLPEATLEQTLKRAEQIRAASKHLTIQYQDHTYGDLSISVGVAMYPEHGASVEDILRAADKALYRAKAQGRDCVAVGPIANAAGPS